MSFGLKLNGNSSAKLKLEFLAKKHQKQKKNNKIVGTRRKMPEGGVIGSILPVSWAGGHRIDSPRLLGGIPKRARNGLVGSRRGVKEFTD